MMQFFPVNSLILGNFAGDRFVSDCAHHQPSLASQATARQATPSPIVAKQAKAGLVPLPDAPPWKISDQGTMPKKAGYLPKVTRRS